MRLLARMSLPLVLAVGFTVISGEATASSALGVGEQAVRWDLARTASGKPAPTRRRTRSIKLQYGIGACAPDGRPVQSLSRVVVRRRRSSVLITVIVRDTQPADGTFCYGLLKLVTKRVSLRGRLGKRSIKDGVYSPAQVVVRAPKR